MNEKGIIRIIEASAAIVIIFIVILTLTTTRKPSTEQDLSKRITPLLEEIAKNNSMRTDIVGEASTINLTMEAFLRDRIKEPKIGYNFTICDIDEVCSLARLPEGIVGNIYAGSRIISSSLGTATPKRVSIFLWFKK
jgi:hypothetical protein